MRKNKEDFSADISQIPTEKGKSLPIISQNEEVLSSDNSQVPAEKENSLPLVQSSEKELNPNVEEVAVKQKIPKKVSFEIDGIIYENETKKLDPVISEEIFGDHIETDSGMKISLVPKANLEDSNQSSNDCSVGTDSNELWYNDTTTNETDGRSYEDIIYDDSKDEEKIAQIRRSRLVMNLDFCPVLKRMQLYVVMLK